MIGFYILSATIIKIILTETVRVPHPHACRTRERARPFAASPLRDIAKQDVARLPIIINFICLPELYADLRQPLRKININPIISACNTRLFTADAC